VLNGFLLGSQAMAAALGGWIAYLIGVRQAIVLSLVVACVVGIWGTIRPPHELKHRTTDAKTPR